MKFKKIAIMALCAGMVIAPNTYANAEEVTNENQQSVAAIGEDWGTYMTYIANAECNLVLDPPNAIAYVDADLTCYSSVTKCKIVIELQQSTSNGWETVKRWSKNIDDNSLELAGEADIEKGTYRNRTTVTAYSGTKSETYTIISGTSVYK